MTEEKAKSVLDFLARRAGWLYVSLRENIQAGDHWYKFVPYLESKNIASPFWIDTLKTKKHISSRMVGYDKKPSWNEVLEEMFNILGNGSLQVSDGCRQKILRQNETLESIMIEMDLKNVEGNDV